MDHRASLDIHEAVENIFMPATEFMHESGLRIDEDHFGKPKDLYFRYSVGGSKNCGLCPMRFTSCCPCTICIT